MKNVQILKRTTPMRTHHIGIASSDIKKSIKFHQKIFNLHPITDIIKDPILKVSLVLLSDSERTNLPIELISPLEENSPVSNLLKKGIHLYHICYAVKDIELALKKAREQGAKVILKPLSARLYNQKKVAFVFTPDGYIVEFLEEK
jgi:methylmalonyl-CoA/ethylmalonyl-CoA epimerase